MMKKIEAIIRPEKLDAVRKVLEQCGYPGITITEIEGHGLQKGLVQKWRGEEFRIETLPKIKVEIVVADKNVEVIVAAILEEAYTGNVGDGKLFVSEIAEAIRIRTKERGEKALS